MALERERERDILHQMCCTQNPGEYLLGDPHWKAGVCEDCQNAYVQKASRATSSQ